MPGDLFPGCLNRVELRKKVSRQLSFQFQVHKRYGCIEIFLLSTRDHEDEVYNVKSEDLAWALTVRA